MATKQKPAPPPPPRLMGKEEAASFIRSQPDDEQAERSSVDDIRSDLQDAYESIAAAWEKLDTLEADQS